MDVITIIVPVFNGEKYIKRCIESIINQTYKKIEIIIINDGSTDNSLNIIREYFNDNRIKIIDKQNGGVSSARNVGIKNATGKYVTFVDCDDWIEKDSIEILYKLIKEKKVDVIRSNYVLDDQTGNKIKVGNLYKLENKIFINEDIINHVLKHFICVNEFIPNYTPLLFIDKEALDRIPNFNENLYMMEDADYYLKMFCNIKSIFFTSRITYHYCVNEESVTKDKTKYIKNIIGIIEANKSMRDNFMKHGIDKKDLIAKLNANHLRLITNFIFYAYKNNVTDKKEIIYKIFKNKEIEIMFENYNLSKIPLKNKILIIFLKFKWIIPMFVILNIYCILKR